MKAIEITAVTELDDARAQFNALADELQKNGVAVDALSRLQNKLAKEMTDAQKAASDLAIAQQRLAVNTDGRKQLELEVAVNKAQVALDKAGNTVLETSRDFQVLKTAEEQAARATQEAGLSFEDLKQFGDGLREGLGLVEEGLHAAEQGYRAIIEPTLKYSDEVRGLSNALGTSSQESSQLLAISGELGVSTSSLESAFKIALKHGIEPNLAGIKELGEKYRSIKDPLEQAQFAMKVFGRNGLEMIPILKQSGEALDEMAAKAQVAGKILSDQDVKSARALEVAIHDLTESYSGLTTQIALATIPTLTAASTDLQGNVNSWNLYNKAVSEGKLSTLEQVQALGLMLPFIRDDTKAQALLTDKLSEQKASVSDLSGTYQDYVIKAVKAHEATGALSRGTLEIVQAVMQQGEFTAEDARAVGALSNAEFQAAKSAENLTSSQSVLNDMLRQSASGTVSADFAARGLKETQELLAAGMSGTVSQAQKGYTDTLASTKDELDKVNAELEKYSGRTGDYSGKIKDLTDKQSALQAKIDAAREAEEKQTAQFLFNKTAANLSADGQLELARSLGLIDEKSYNAEKALLSLENKLKAGLITPAQYAAAVVDAAHSLDTYGVIIGKIPPQAQVAADAMKYVNDTIAATPSKTVIFDTSSIPPTARVASDAIDIVNAAMGRAGSKSVDFTTNIHNNVFDYHSTENITTNTVHDYHSTEDIPGHAAGGRYGMEPATFHERGPELLFPDRPGFAMNNMDSNRLIAALESLVKQMGSSGPKPSGSTNVYLQGGSDTAELMAKLRPYAVGG